MTDANRIGELVEKLRCIDIDGMVFDLERTTSANYMHIIRNKTTLLGYLAKRVREAADALETFAEAEKMRAEFGHLDEPLQARVDRIMRGEQMQISSQTVAETAIKLAKEGAPWVDDGRIPPLPSADERSVE